MLEKLDFLVRFWELKARHALLGEPLQASEQIELLSLFQLVTGDLDLPAAGPLARHSDALVAEMSCQGSNLLVEIRSVSAAAIFVVSKAQVPASASVVLKAVVSGVEFTLPCRVAWSHGSGPVSLALCVDGIPMCDFYNDRPRATWLS